MKFDDFINLGFNNSKAHVLSILCQKYEGLSDLFQLVIPKEEVVEIDLFTAIIESLIDILDTNTKKIILNDEDRDFFIQKLEESEKSNKNETLAGCFHCMKRFDILEINEWLDHNTGVCPKCGVDSVILYPKDDDLLKAHINGFCWSSSDGENLSWDPTKYYNTYVKPRFWKYKKEEE